MRTANQQTDDSVTKCEASISALRVQAGKNSSKLNALEERIHALKIDLSSHVESFSFRQLEYDLRDLKAQCTTNQESLSRVWQELDRATREGSKSPRSSEHPLPSRVPSPIGAINPLFETREPGFK